MTLRIALSVAAAAAPLFLAPSAATAVPCVPNSVGNWCYDPSDPTELPCIEGNFDPLWARLVECR